ncbi:MAG: hypothetical protein PWQ08_1284 [Clostridiales bacterium]|jgi:hypothetical protein|nr:hypothetical protein [Clostridiales bacterium]
MKITRSAVEETKQRSKKELLFLILPFLHIVLFIWAFSNSFTVINYNLDNYRYVFSALLQVIGSIFAFIASSTLVVLQLLHSAAPNGARFYSKKVFSSFLVVNVIVLFCDTAAILWLEPTVTSLKQIVLNLLITINVYPVFLAFLYIFYVIQYLTPEYQVKHIIREAKHANNNNERRSIVLSLEEMFLTSIKSGQGGNVRLYQNAFSEIISIFTNTKTKLNSRSKFEPDHPLRLIPDIMERITASLIDNDMNNLLHYNGHILRELSGSKYEGNNIVDVEIATAVENITSACMAHSCITDLSNFSANFIMCADEKSEISTIFWGTRFLINELSKYCSKEATYVFNHVVSDLRYLIDNVDIKNASEFEQMVSFLENQKSLINACAENSCNNIEKEIKDMKVYIHKKCDVTV